MVLVLPAIAVVMMGRARRPGKISSLKGRTTVRSEKEGGEPQAAGWRDLWPDLHAEPYVFAAAQVPPEYPRSRSSARTRGRR